MNEQFVNYLFAYNELNYAITFIFRVYVILKVIALDVMVVKCARAKSDTSLFYSFLIFLSANKTILKTNVKCRVPHHKTRSVESNHLYLVPVQIFL